MYDMIGKCSEQLYCRWRALSAKGVRHGVGALYYDNSGKLNRGHTVYPQSGHYYSSCTDVRIIIWKDFRKCYGTEYV